VPAIPQYPVTDAWDGVSNAMTLPARQARDMVTALAEEIREEPATKEFFCAELANLRYQMLAAHVASFIALALLIVFRT
jgi:hypothetical protein